MSNRKGYSIFQRGGRGVWYVSWRDGHKRRRTVKGSLNKAIAHEIGRAKVAEADRVRGGVIDDVEVRASTARREPVENHVALWEKVLLARQNTPKHASQSAQRVRTLLRLGHVSSLGDLDSDAITPALAVVIEKETARTARHYLTSLRAWVRWCRETGRLLNDPILGVKPPPKGEKTFRRTAISDEQLSAILDAAMSRKGTRSPVSNRDRCMFYRLLAYTGLRRSEAVSLMPESFTFSDDENSVVVEAAYSKHRRRDTIPLRGDFATMLKPWLAKKKPGKQVFAYGKHTDFEGMFARDCKLAGVKKAPGEILGLHSFRRFFITRAGRGGGLAVAQDLARHSTPALTKEYMDLNLVDWRRGLDGLPPVVASKAKGRSQKRSAS